MAMTHDQISSLAYQFWKERGEPFGSPEIDWERAEATLQLKAVDLVQSALSPDSGRASAQSEELNTEEAYTDRPTESARGAQSTAKVSDADEGNTSSKTPGTRASRPSKRKPTNKQAAP